MLGEYPVVSVHLPPALSALAGGREDILVSGETVGDVLRAAARECAALNGLFRSDGKLPPGVEVFLGAHSVRGLQGLATPVALEERVSVVPGRRSAAAERQAQARRRRPFDSVEQVLDEQAELGVAGDFQFAVEEQRVRVFLAGEQLQEGGQVGGERQVGFARRLEDGQEAPISIGE